MAIRKLTLAAAIGVAVAVPAAAQNSGGITDPGSAIDAQNGLAADKNEPPGATMPSSGSGSSTASGGRASTDRSTRTSSEKNARSTTSDQSDSSTSDGGSSSDASNAIGGSYSAPSTSNGS